MYVYIQEDRKIELVIYKGEDVGQVSQIQRTLSVVAYLTSVTVYKRRTCHIKRKMTRDYTVTTPSDFMDLTSTTYEKSKLT